MRQYLFVLIALVTLCFSAPAQEKETIKIAVCGPFTGGGADFGRMIAKGVDLKVKEINAAGGINGQKVEWEQLDDASDPNQASTIAQKAADNNKYCSVIGHFNSTCSLAAKPIYRRAGIVSLSPGSTNVDVCQGSDWFFRNLYRDDFQGQYVASYIAKILKLKKVAVIYDNDDYGKGLKNHFKNEAKNLGLELVAEEAYNRDGNLDFNGIVTKIKSKKPDIVFVSGLYSEAAKIAKLLGRKKVKAGVIGGDGVFSPKFIELAKDAAEGTFIITPYVNDVSSSSKIAEFSKKFKAANKGEEPDAWAALSYDAMGTLAQVIAKVGTDRKAIRQGLAAIRSENEAYDGVTGLTYFDKNGDCVKPAIVATVTDGKFAKAKKQLSGSVEEDGHAGHNHGDHDGHDHGDHTGHDHGEKKQGNGLLILIGIIAVVILILVIKKPKS